MDQNDVTVPNKIVAASKIRNLTPPPASLYAALFYFVPSITFHLKLWLNNVKLPWRNARISPLTPGILSHFFEFDKSGMNYKVHFCINHYDDWYVASDELVNAIWYQVARKGIRFAHQRHLNVTSAEDEKGACQIRRLTKRPRSICSNACNRYLCSKVWSKKTW